MLFTLLKILQYKSNIDADTILYWVIENNWLLVVESHRESTEQNKYMLCMYKHHIYLTKLKLQKVAFSL